MDKEILNLELWERQPGETPKAFAAFVVYRDLDPSVRSVPKAGEKLGKSVGTLERWVYKYKWRERVAAWDAEVERIRTQEHFERIKRMRDRHAELGELMVEVSTQAMKSLQERPHRISATAATQMAAEGTKIERLGRGDAGDVIEERDGGPVEFNPVQFYLPNNGRDQKDREGE